MKTEHKQGWFRVRPSALRSEVTYFDGRNTYCEDLKTREYSVAADYCRARIEAAAPPTE